MSDNSFSLIWKEFKSNFRSVAMVVLLFALWIIFQILTGGIFLTARNLNNLFLQMAFIGIACTGMVLVMVAGHIDLSAGSVIGFTGAVMAVMLQNLHAHFGVALVVTLIVGILIGAWNALWVAYFNIPAFIVTLSSELVFRGGVLGILHSKTVQPNNDMFRMVGQGYLPHPEQGIDIIAIVLCTIVILGFLILSLRSRDEKKKYGFQVASPVSFICKTGAICLAIIGVFVIWMKDRGVPFPILLLCLIVVAMTVLSTKAPFGKHVFAIGGNRDAARLSGINVKKTTAFVFVIAGFMTAIAGVVYTSRQIGRAHV